VRPAGAGRLVNKNEKFSCHFASRSKPAQATKVSSLASLTIRGEPNADDQKPCTKYKKKPGPKDRNSAGAQLDDQEWREMPDV
jgi:hypothetical protein